MIAGIEWTAFLWTAAAAVLMTAALCYGLAVVFAPFDRQQATTPEPYEGMPETMTIKQPDYSI